MDKKDNAQYAIDELASQAGGYFSMPTQEDRPPQKKKHSLKK